MEETHDLQARLGWVKLYQSTRNAGFVCRRCGISRPTLRTWWRRYQAEGEAGLRARSRRPHRSPARKLTAENKQWILRMGKERKLGHKRIRDELLRLHQLRLSTATILKVLRQLDDRLGECQFFYNWQRPHSALGSKTPMDRFCELHEKTPVRSVVWEAYEREPEVERIRDFRLDLQQLKLQRSL